MPQLRFTLGVTLAIAALLGLAEGFLRLFPPSDLLPILVEQSGLTVLYKTDPAFAVAY